MKMIRRRPVLRAARATARAPPTFVSSNRPGGRGAMPCSAASSARGPDGRWATCLPLGEHSRLVSESSASFEVIEADDKLRLYNGSWGTVMARSRVYCNLLGLTTCDGGSLCRGLSKFRVKRAEGKQN